MKEKNMRTKHCENCDRALDCADGACPNCGREVEKTHAALDGLHVGELVGTFEQLEKLEQAATPAPWKLEEESPKTPAVPLTKADAERYGCEYKEGLTMSVLGLSVDNTAQFATQADADFITALRNAAPVLIRQCLNQVAIVADLDGVHEALGTDYSTSAAASVRDLKSAVARGLRLAGDYVELRNQLEEANRKLRLMEAQTETLLTINANATRTAEEDNRNLHLVLIGKETEPGYRGIAKEVRRTMATKDDVTTVVVYAFEAGYISGHNATVEGNFCCDTHQAALDNTKAIIEAIK